MVRVWLSLLVGAVGSAALSIAFRNSLEASVAVGLAYGAGVACVVVLIERLAYIAAGE